MTDTDQQQGAVRQMFADSIAGTTALVATAAMAVFSAYILLRTFRPSDFMSLYLAEYVWVSLVVQLVLSIMVGFALGFVVASLRRGIGVSPAYMGNMFLAVFFIVVASDCPRCGGFLSSLEGNVNAVAIFPFHGLELKLAAALLLLMVLWGMRRKLANHSGANAYAKLPSLLVPTVVGFVVLLLVVMAPDLSRATDFVMPVLQHPEQAPPSCLLH